MGERIPVAETVRRHQPKDKNDQNCLMQSKKTGLLSNERVHWWRLGRED